MGNNVFLILQMNEKLKQRLDNSKHNYVMVEFWLAEKKDLFLS